MKNKFPLEVVLTVRRNAEGSQALRLEDIKRRRREMRDQIDAAQREIESLETGRGSAALSASDLLPLQRWREKLYLEIERLRLDDHKAAREEELQRKALEAAMRERKKLERMKERWAERRALALAKAEAAEMDEIGRFQWIREAVK